MLLLLLLLTGLMAGIYFTFSVVVIKAFNELSNLQASQAMNKINDVILNTVFMPIFFGSTLWYAGLIVWAMTDWQGHMSTLTIMASVTYITGMFLTTAFGNVPLNNRLKNHESDDHGFAAFWPEYQASWLRLNHVRTLACSLSTILLAYSLTL